MSTLLFTDTFTDINGTSILSHTSDTGQTYNKCGFSSSIIDYFIDGNQLELSQSTDNTYYYTFITGLLSDQYVKYTNDYFDPDLDSTFSVFLRVGTPNNPYIDSIHFYLATNFIFVQQWKSGNGTDLGFIDLGEITSNDVYEFRTIGNNPEFGGNAQVFKNDVLILEIPISYNNSFGSYVVIGDDGGFSRPKKIDNLIISNYSSTPTTNIKSFNNLSYINVKNINLVTLINIKSFNGLS